MRAARRPRPRALAEEEAVAQWVATVDDECRVAGDVCSACDGSRYGAVRAECGLGLDTAKEVLAGDAGVDDLLADAHAAARVELGEQCARARAAGRAVYLSVGEDGDVANVRV